MVRREKLHRFVDKKRVHEAIVAAEGSTDVSIFVSIAPYFWGSVRRTAELALRKHTRTRSGAVLFFVVPARREFAVVGDAAAHEILGQQTWDAVAAAIEARLREGDPTVALVQGIEALGQELARHE